MSEFKSSAVKIRWAFAVRGGSVEMHTHCELLTCSKPIESAHARSVQISFVPMCNKFYCDPKMSIRISCLVSVDLNSVYVRARFNNPCK